MQVPDLKSNHRETDPRNALHAVFTSSADDTDDMDVYILLCISCYGRIYPVSVLLWKSVLSTRYWFIQWWNHLPSCEINRKPFGKSSVQNNASFHALTGSNYTNPFFGQSKYSIFKNIQQHSNAERLLLSLNTERVEVPDVIDFIIRIVYNRPKS